MANITYQRNERAYRLGLEALEDCKNLGRSRLPLVGTPKLAVDTINQHIEDGVMEGNVFRDAYESGWAE